VPDAEWSDFKIILALSRGGSVAAAARLLGIDNSTVSRRLAAIEEALGATLVLRGGREFLFTAAGNLALAAASAMEQAAAGAHSQILAAVEKPEGTVRISTVSSLVHRLSPVIAQLRANYPRLRVEVSDSNQAADLASGAADVALRMFRPAEPDLVIRKACDFPWFLYASPAYLAQHGRPQSYADLRRHSLILYAEERLHRPQFRWLEDYNADPNPFRVSTPIVALQAAVAGDGIAALPAYEIGRDHSLERVFATPCLTTSLWIVFHESVRDAARIRAVVDALAAIFANPAMMSDGLAPPIL
jgi:DNA-binding transcriptional LysR family regulator